MWDQFNHSVLAMCSFWSMIVFNWYTSESWCPFWVPEIFCFSQLYGFLLSVLMVLWFCDNLKIFGGLLAERTAMIYNTQKSLLKELNYIVHWGHCCLNSLLSYYSGENRTGILDGCFKMQTLGLSFNFECRCWGATPHFLHTDQKVLLSFFFPLHFGVPSCLKFIVLPHSRLQCCRSCRLYQSSIFALY